MFSTTRPCELAQGTTRVVTCRELALNSNTNLKNGKHDHFDHFLWHLEIRGLCYSDAAHYNLGVTVLIQSKDENLFTIEDDLILINGIKTASNGYNIPRLYF